MKYREIEEGLKNGRVLKVVYGEMYTANYLTNTNYYEIAYNINHAYVELDIRVSFYKHSLEFISKTQFLLKSVKFSGNLRKVNCRKLTMT